MKTQSLTLAITAIALLTQTSAQEPPRKGLATPIEAPVTSRAAELLKTAPSSQWFKGNLHTHSLWSDGDDYPEIIVDWYKQREYHFLVLSDHNTLAEGERYLKLTQGARGAGETFERYLERFGEDWVETREAEGVREVKLKTFAEYRTRFEEEGAFLLMQSEEITDSFERKPLHINVTNIKEKIVPRGGKSVVDVLQRNIDAVLQQRRLTKQPMIPHVNHPNFGYAITAEQLAAVKGERFFEVYNGHPAVHNEGDRYHASTERMWDIILAQRLSQPEGEIMYGVATDDSHNYSEFNHRKSNPGRAWVMVRAETLTASALIAAMERGDFYGSNGVELQNVSSDGRIVSVLVKAEPGIDYTIEFVGTRRGFDTHSEPIKNIHDAPLAVTRRYSDEIGSVFARHEGPRAFYRFQGDELYVRAKVTSTKKKENPYKRDQVEMAWTQPLRPGEVVGR